MTKAVYPHGNRLKDAEDPTMQTGRLCAGAHKDPTSMCEHVADTHVRTAASRCDNIRPLRDLLFAARE